MARFDDVGRGAQYKQTPPPPPLLEEEEEEFNLQLQAHHLLHVHECQHTLLTLLLLTLLQTILQELNLQLVSHDLLHFHSHLREVADRHHARAQCNGGTGGGGRLAAAAGDGGGKDGGQAVGDAVVSGQSVDAADVAQDEPGEEGLWGARLWGVRQRCAWNTVMDRGAQLSRSPFSCLHGADVGAGGQGQRGGGDGGNGASQELEDRRAAADTGGEGRATVSEREVHTKRKLQRQGTDCTRAVALSTRAGDEGRVGGGRGSGDGDEGAGAGNKTSRCTSRSRWTTAAWLSCAFKSEYHKSMIVEPLSASRECSR